MVKITKNRDISAFSSPERRMPCFVKRKIKYILSTIFANFGLRGREKRYIIYGEVLRV